MRCVCGEPLTRCDHRAPLCQSLCNGWHHTRTGLHHTPEHTATPATKATLDTLAIFDGPDWDWRHEAAMGVAF